MTLSRKDFLRQSFFSLGDNLLKAGETVRKMQGSLHPPDRVEPEAEPAPGEHMVAQADNGHCLARSCGCFSCLERCEVQAITLVMGQGISIDPALCTGCGACRDICPITPKGVALVSRGEAVSSSPSSPAEASAKAGTRGI
jgi:ferredoxin